MLIVFALFALIGFRARALVAGWMAWQTLVSVHELVLRLLAGFLGHAELD